MDMTDWEMTFAHGQSFLDPEGWRWLQAWPFEPGIWLGLALAAAAYLFAYSRVPAFPKRRCMCFLVGIGVIALALCSPIGAYDTALFWVHMHQHLLLTLIAAPLLLLGAPVALAMRAATPALRVQFARAVNSPLLHAVTHPLITWFAFVAVMWATHFSPLYNEALENELWHTAEHALYLGVGLLYWWPVIGLDPGSRRLQFPARLLYLFLTMPTHAFLGLAITSASYVLYPHYATQALAWGMDPLQDQQLAGVVMWVEAGLLFVIAFVMTFFAWMRHADRDAARLDRRLDLAITRRSQLARNQSEERDAT